IEDVILRLASLKDDLPEVSELDIEPVIVNANGLLALSARAKVMPTTDRRGQWYVRQLSQPSGLDRKSTRLNSSHVSISYAVFCLKKKKNDARTEEHTAELQ